MAIQPSAAAIDIAEQLSALGLGTDPILVQRWRERGLLGSWSHVKNAGRGSTAEPAADAFDRALVCRRLQRAERNKVNVTILTWLAHTSPSVDDVTAAIAEFLENLRLPVTPPDGTDIDEYANTLVQRTFASRRGGRELRRQANRLKDVPHPYDATDLDPPTTEDRVRDVHAESFALFATADTDVFASLTDMLHLRGLDNIIRAADLSDPTTAADVGGDLVVTIRHMRDAMVAIREGKIDETALVSARRMVELFSESADWESLRSGVEPISKPLERVASLIQYLLSELVAPGALRAAAEAALHRSGDTHPKRTSVQPQAP